MWGDVRRLTSLVSPAKVRASVCAIVTAPLPLPGVESDSCGFFNAEI